MKKAIISLAAVLALCLCSCTEDSGSTSGMGTETESSSQETSTDSESSYAKNITSSETSQTSSEASTTTMSETSSSAATTTKAPETTTSQQTTQQTTASSKTTSSSAVLPSGDMTAEAAKAYVKKFCDLLTSKNAGAAYDMSVPPDQEAEYTKKYKDDIESDKNANDLRSCFINRINASMDSFKSNNVTLELKIIAFSTIGDPEPIKKAIPSTETHLTVLSSIDIADAGSTVYAALVEEKDYFPQSEYETSYEIMYVFRHGGKWYVKSPSIL